MVTMMQIAVGIAKGQACTREELEQQQTTGWSSRQAEEDDVGARRQGLRPYMKALEVSCVKIYDS